MDVIKSDEVTTALEKAQNAAYQYILKGDLSTMSPAQQSEFCVGLCEKMGLNALTRPFEFMKLSGKMTLYAKKDCTDQLRKVYSVSIEIKDRQMTDGVCIVTASARLPSGRTDESIGAVSIKGLSGDALCNAVMKAETKAKRRATLSICGLGLLDETELETIPRSAFEDKKESPKKTEVEIKDDPLDLTTPLEEYVIEMGSFKGKKLSELSGDDAQDLQANVLAHLKKVGPAGGPIVKQMQRLLHYLSLYLGEE